MTPLKYKIIIFALVSLNILTGILYFKEHESITDNFINPYPYLDLSRNFIEQKDFIVNIQPLRDSLNDLFEDYGNDRVSAYVEFLNTGSNITINSDARFYPASLIKMPVAIATARNVQDGIWDWDNELVVFEDDVDTKSGDLGNSPIGTRFTIKKLLSELLKTSDNTAYKMLLRNLGAGEINRYLVDTGLSNFFDNDLNITTKEYTRLFRSLYTSSYLTREYSQQLLTWLGEAERNYLALGLPESIVYSHKFGENIEEYIFADAGIVYLENRPYVMTVIYSGDNSDDKEKIDEFFKKTSEIVYEYFKNY